MALCEGAERVVLRLLAAQAGSLLGQAKAESWLPNQPPRTASAHSVYVTSLLSYLKVPGPVTSTLPPPLHPSYLPRGLYL